MTTKPWDLSAACAKYAAAGVLGSGAGVAPRERNDILEASEDGLCITKLWGHPVTSAKRSAYSQQVTFPTQQYKSS